MPFALNISYEDNYMRKLMIAPKTLIALALILSSLAPTCLRAEDTIEKAGVAVGVTAGNMWVIPLKAISATNGILTGALSFVLTGGNLSLTQQIWQDTLQGPYMITPELAHKAIGERPELSETK
jgi:hypothetical protein